MAVHEPPRAVLQPENVRHAVRPLHRTVGAGFNFMVAGRLSAGGPVNVIPGRIGDVVYLGGTVRYTARLAGDETVAVEEPHSPGRPVHAPGLAVWLEFDPAHCRLFAGE